MTLLKQHAKLLGMKTLDEALATVPQDTFHEAMLTRLRRQLRRVKFEKTSAAFAAIRTTIAALVECGHTIEQLDFWSET